MSASSHRLDCGGDHDDVIPIVNPLRPGWGDMPAPPGWTGSKRMWSWISSLRVVEPAGRVVRAVRPRRSDPIGCDRAPPGGLALSAGSLAVRQGSRVSQPTVKWSHQGSVHDTVAEYAESDLPVPEPFMARIWK